MAVERPNEELENALGDIPEYGGGPRVLLPESYYISEISIDDPDVSEQGGQDGETILEDDSGPVLDANGVEVLVGGSPYVGVTVEVQEGPFAGCDFTGRFYLTPGKGRNIGFVNHAVKAITGKPVDLSTVEKFGFQIPTGSREEAQQAFRKHYLALSPDDRLEFMSRYARLALWDGRHVIVKVGRESRVIKDEATGSEETRWFNRIQGFYALDDGKKGAGFVRSKCHAKQEAIGLDEGTLEAEAVTGN